jgi:hypothetical protein
MKLTSWSQFHRQSCSPQAPIVKITDDNKFDNINTFIVFKMKRNLEGQRSAHHMRSFTYIAVPAKERHDAPDEGSSVNEQDHAQGALVCHGLGCFDLRKGKR